MQVSLASRTTMPNFLTAARALLPAIAYPYAGRSEACVLCEGREVRVIARTDRRLKPLTTVCCAGCGLIRVDPMPTEAELAAYYRVLYRLDYQLAGRRAAPPRFHLTRSRREAERRAALLAPVLRPGARVLDLGAGSGEFLALAARRGCETLGIEPGEDYARYAREAHGLAVLAQGWAEAELSPGSFDLVTVNHVIEHLRDPVAALARIAAWLRPGTGRAFVAVPDLAAPSRRPPFERFHFAHVHNFVPETLRAAAARAGLQPDPDYPGEGCTLVLRHAAAGPLGAAAVADPARAARVAAAFPQVSVARHLLGFGWAGGMIRRARRWAADSGSRPGAAGGAPPPPGTAAAKRPSASPRRPLRGGALG
jgi:2-polyprenyl-3-methyl-5-hydroxy-6-metoxy-1,4-benzoquinol methylase